MERHSVPPCVRSLHGRHFGKKRWFLLYSHSSPEMFYVPEGNASSSAPLECCAVKLEQQFGQFPVCRQLLPWDYFRLARYPPGIGIGPCEQNGGRDDEFSIHAWGI